jgi:hypothetical protein
MATFTSRTSLNRSLSLLQFQLEALACGLPRQGANERAKRCVRASATTSTVFRTGANPVRPAAPRSRSSSFGHDTPAHSERRCRQFFRTLKWAHWVRLPTHRLLTGVSPWQRDDSDDM